MLKGSRRRESLHTAGRHRQRLLAEDIALQIVDDVGLKNTANGELQAAAARKGFHVLATFGRPLYLVEPFAGDHEGCRRRRGLEQSSAHRALICVESSASCTVRTVEALGFGDGL